MIKKYLYHSLFCLNIVSIILAIVHMILFWNGYTMDDLHDLMNWRMNITYFVVAFWIWNIVIWSKRDKQIGRFFALFFLIGLYTLFYYRHVLKNKWLDKQE